MKTKKTILRLMLGALMIMAAPVSKGQNWLLVGNTNATNASKLGATVANVNLNLYAGNAERMRILGSNGYVGIGLTAPTAKLHVSGTTKLAGATTITGLTTTTTIKITGGAPGVNKILRSDATGLATWVAASSVETDPQVGTNTTNRVPRWNGSALVTGTIFDNSTNVGIGTTTPGTKLQVIGTHNITNSRTAFSFTELENTLSLNNTDPNYYPGISLYSSASPGTGGGIFGNLFSTGINITAPAGTYAPCNASAFNVASDRRMKKDIVDININHYDKYINYIRNIESATFLYKDETAQSRPVPHLGVIAQSLPAEVQAHISSNPSGKGEERLGVSLADMQGLLVVGIKALDQKQTDYEAKLAEKDARIAALEGKMQQFEQALSQCCTNFKSSNSSSIDIPTLEQNEPNPFNQQSVIKYFVPSDFRTAQLIITDMRGAQLKAFDIKQSGVGQVTVNASELSAGSYLYSLVIDGAKAISKKMELTK